MPRRTDVPQSLLDWERDELAWLRLRRFTEAQAKKRRRAAERLCAILEELATPLVIACGGSAVRPAMARSEAKSLLDAAARTSVDAHVARMAALSTMVACATLPGLVYRTAARIELFTLRPCNEGPDGACVMKVWEVARAACAGRETGSLGYTIFASEAEAAVSGYLGAPNPSAADLEAHGLSPRWPLFPS